MIFLKKINDKKISVAVWNGFLKPAVCPWGMEIDFFSFLACENQGSYLDAYSQDFKLNTNQGTLETLANGIKSHIGTKAISGKRNKQGETIKILASGKKSNKETHEMLRAK